MPDWNKLVVTWSEMTILPQSWLARLRNWRGVYLIRDSSDGRLYVGSAYGIENIEGRWKNYLSNLHGSNKHLKARNPQNFVFSILQIVAHDLPADEVIAIDTNLQKY